MKSFNPAQTAGLDQRLALLNSFLEPQTRGSHTSTQKSPRFTEGELTIVDLSDPFIDPGSACGLFEIVTRLFVRAEVDTGKVLVVDEAHKASTICGSQHFGFPDLAPVFVDKPGTLWVDKGTTDADSRTKTPGIASHHQHARSVRHFACIRDFPLNSIDETRRAEPTVVPPILLDLCTVAIMHRFSSPSWWEHLAQHVSANVSIDEGFDRVVSLQVGLDFRGMTCML